MPRDLNYSVLFFIAIFMSSCLSKNINAYYNNNHNVLDSIEQSYKAESKKRHFTLEFTNKLFDHVSVEIWTDSIKYIYEFSTTEKRLSDTLLKYNLSPAAINKLIGLMQSIHCTWVNNLDYYAGAIKKLMVFISIRPHSYSLFANKKYYIIAYFNAPQYYDKDGKLMVNRRLRRVRMINADVFHRINDRVAYAISDRFR